MLSILRRLATLALGYYRREPVRVNTVIASVVVAGLGLAGIVVPKQSVLDVLAYVVPILGLGQVARAKVSPSR